MKAHVTPRDFECQPTLALLQALSARYLGSAERCGEVVALDVAKQTYANWVGPYRRLGPVNFKAGERLQGRATQPSGRRR